MPGPRLVESPRRRAVSVPHPDTGKPVLVTREEVARYGADDLRVLNAAQRYDEAQIRHGRLIHALRPYSDDSTSVGEAMRRAAADLGIDGAGRSSEALAELVVGSADARGGASAG